MICAIRVAAMRYWFLECHKYPVEPELITYILKAMFRHYAYAFGLRAKLHKLIVQPRCYSMFMDRFAEMSCQLPSLPVAHLMNSF